MDRITKVSLVILFVAIIGVCCFTGRTTEGRIGSGFIPIDIGGGGIEPGGCVGPICEVSRCGDGLCNGTETSWSCSSDCGRTGGGGEIGPAKVCKVRRLVRDIIEFGLVDRCKAGTSDEVAAPVILLPQSSGVTQMTTPLLVSHSGGTSCDYNLDNGESTGALNNQVGTYYSTVLTGLSEGAHTVKVTCYNASGQFNYATVSWMKWGEGGQKLYATGNGTLYTLDANTGQKRSEIGNIGFNVRGLAIDPTNGRLYGSTATIGENTGGPTNPPSGCGVTEYCPPGGGGVESFNPFINIEKAEAAGEYIPASLIRINTNSGSGSLIGETGYTLPECFAYPCPHVNITLDEIAFDANGNLFGWSENDSALYSVNKTTGAIMPIGPSGVTSFGSGLARDAYNKMYLVPEGEEGSLYTLNLSSGAVENALGIQGSSGNSYAFSGLAFDKSNMLFGLRDNGDGVSDLVVIDHETGTIASLGQTSDVENLEAIAFQYASLKPEVQILSPNNGDEVELLTPVTVSTNMPAICQYRMDSGSFSPMTTTNDYLHEDVTNGLRVGSHTIQVRCTDSLGQNSTDASARFSKLQAGILYATDGESDTPSLWIMDPMTGIKTLVGSMPGYHIISMAFTASGDTLYGVTRDDGDGNKLVTIDRETGQVTDGPLITTPEGTTISVTGLTTKNGDVLVLDEERNMYTIDTVSGAASIFETNALEGINDTFMGLSYISDKRTWVNPIYNDGIRISFNSETGIREQTIPIINGEQEVFTAGTSDEGDNFLGIRAGDPPDMIVVTRGGVTGYVASTSDLENITAMAIYHGSTEETPRAVSGGGSLPGMLPGPGGLGAMNGNQNGGGQDNTNGQVGMGVPSIPPPSAVKPEPPVPTRHPSVFTDVSGHWSEGFIDKLMTTCSLEGYKESSSPASTSLNPNKLITRGELIYLLVHCAYGELEAPQTNPYRDVLKSSWYAPYIAKAKELGWIDSASNFYPNRNIDRASALKMILLSQLSEADIDYSGGANFSDVEKGSWYERFIGYAFMEGYVQGYLDYLGNPTGAFGPGKEMTRAEAIKVITLVNGW